MKTTLALLVLLLASALAAPARAQDGEAPSCESLLTRADAVPARRAVDPVVGRASGFADLFVAAFRAPQARTLSARDATRAAASRTCMMSFPWTSAEREGLHSTGLPSPDVIIARLERTRAVLSTMPPRPLAPHERALRQEVRRGRDGQVVLRFGEFLVALSLFRAGRLEDVLTRVGSMDLRVTQAEWESGPDNASDATYYRDDELRKMLGALRDQALASLGRMDAEDAVSALERVQYLGPYAAIVGGRGGLSTHAERLLTIAAPRGTVEHIGHAEFLSISLASRYLLARRPTSDRAWELLAPSDAATVLQAELDRVVAARSTATTEVWSLVPFGARVRLTRPGATVDVSTPFPTACSAMLADTQAAGRRNVVVYVPEFVRRDGRLRARSLIADSQAQGTAVRLFLDDPLPSAVPHAEAASSLTVGGTISAVIPSELGVLDGRVIQNLQDDLTAAGVSVTRFAAGTSWSGPSGGAVIVLSGHSAPELEVYVRALAAAGVFNGNHVVFGSCGTELTEALRGQVLRAGAASVMGFEGTITNANVHDLVDTLLRQRSAAPSEGLFDHLIRRIREIGVRGVWQVSENWPATSNWGFA